MKPLSAIHTGVSFATGIAFWNAGPSIMCLVAALFGCALVVAACRFPVRRPRWNASLLLCVFWSGFAGGAVHSASIVQQKSRLGEVGSGDIQINAVVRGVTSGSTILVTPEGPPDPLVIAASTGFRRARRLCVGERVVIRGSGRPVESGYLASLGAHAELEGLPLSKGLPKSFLCSFQRHVARTIDHHVGDQEARGLLHALLLGDRRFISRRVSRSFKTSGLFHLLAVSGLHVMMVGFVLYGIQRPILLRLGLHRRAAQLCRSASTLLLISAYGALTGWSPSVVRATIMGGFLLAGQCLERPTRTLNSLAAAGMFILAISPGEWSNIGFQLSFSAVAGIAILGSPMQRAVRRVWSGTGFLVRFVTANLATSVGATIGTGPLLLYHFGELPLAGLLLNLVAIPLTGVTLMSSLLMVASSFWLTGPVALFAQVSEAGCVGLVRLVVLCEEWSALWVL